MADIDETEQPLLSLDQFPPPNWYDAQGQFVTPGAQQLTAPGYQSVPPGQLPPPMPAPVQNTPRIIGQSTGPTVTMPGQHVAQTPTLQDEVKLPPQSPDAQPVDPYAPQPVDPYASNLGEGVPGVVPGNYPPQTVADVANVQAPTERNVPRETPEEEERRADFERYKATYDHLPPGEQMRALSPEEYAQGKANATREITRQNIQNAADLQSSIELRNNAQRDFEAKQAADAATVKRRAEIEQALIALSQQQPTGEKYNRIAGILGAALGGGVAVYTGGRNQALDVFEQSVDRDFNEQQQRQGNQRQILALRGQLASEGELADRQSYNDKNLYRAAAYDQAIRQHQLEAQNFDPQGTTAAKLQAQMAELAQRKAANVDAALQTYHKQQEDAYKNQWDVAAKQATIARDTKTTLPQRQITNPYTGAAESYGGAPAGGGPAGVGGPATTAGAPAGFGTQLNVYDPFTQEPLYGKRKLTPQETSEVAKQGTSYSKAQHAMAELGAMIKAGGDDKSFAERLMGQTPVRKKFESARAAVLQALANGQARGSLGDEEHDKAAQGIYSLLDKEVPEAEGWLKQLSGGGAEQLLDQLQERVDSQYHDSVAPLGIYVPGTIQHARTVRAPAPTPDVENAVDYAQRGLASAPAGSTAAKDQQASLDEANRRRGEEIERSEEGKREIVHQTLLAQAASSVGHEGATLQTEGLPAPVRAEVESHNQALSRLAAEHKKLLKMVQGQGKGKNEGAIADQALASRDALVAVSQARHRVAASLLTHFDDLSADQKSKLRQIAKDTGFSDDLRPSDARLLEEGRRTESWQRKIDAFRSAATDTLEEQEK